MARIPLEIGEWGKIKRFDTPHGPAARAYRRDGRGMGVHVQRRGDTGAAAERNLTAALKQLAKTATGDGTITAESTFDDLAEYYFTELEDEGTKDGTITTYRSNYDRHVKPELGEVKLTNSRIE
ncbi:tyrosine-type recombinase/integrase [Leucobacter sp. HY1908]